MSPLLRSQPAHAAPDATHLSHASHAGPSRATLRLGGLAGLGFAFGLFLQNAVLLSGAPLPSAAQADVVSFYTDSAWRVALATGWVAVNLPLVLLFVHVAASRLAERPEGVLWGRLARSAAVLLAATFAVTTMLQATLVATMPTLAAEPALLSFAWSLHSAAFALGGAGLGVLLGALSLGARHVPLVPTWMVPVGLVGAALCIAGAAGIVDLVQGGPMLWALMAGFVCWVAFLVTASWGMVRAASR